MQRAYNLKRIHRLEHCLQGVLDCVKRLRVPHYTDETPTLASVLLAEAMVIAQLTDEALAIVERGHDSDPADQRTQAVRDSEAPPEVWEIVWHVPYATGFRDWDPVRATHEMRSVGYLLREEGSTLVVASQQSTADDCSVLCIPRSSVVRRRRLVVAE